MSSARTTKIVSGIVLIIVTILLSANLNAISHLFLHPEFHPVDNNHWLVGTTTGILAVLLITILFFLNKKLSIQLDKKIEEVSLLDSSNTFFKTISENSNDMIHFNDPKGKILYVNPITHKLLGYQSGEIVNEPAGKFIHPDDQDHIREDMGQLASDIDIPPREIRLIKKDGNILDVEVKGFAVKESGELKYIGAILRDISNRKSRLQFKKAKEEWEETFDTITDFVSVHNENFKIIKANKALCEFLGKKQEEIIGSDCFRLFHNLETPFPDCPHKKAIDTGHPVTVDINDPNIGVPLQITCSPFFDKDGVFKGSVHVARNITGAENRSFYRSENLVPICAWCKDIREDDSTYTKIENFIEDNTKYRFTHTICKDCQEKVYPGYVNKKNE